MAVNPKELSRILHSKTGHNTIFNLNCHGQRDTPVMIVDWQYDPIKDTLLHVDLKRIDLTKRIVVKVPVHTHGDPKGVKLQGGIHEIITREIEIECLPDEIPEQFDVERRGADASARVSASRDIPLTRFDEAAEPVRCGDFARGRAEGDVQSRLKRRRLWQLPGTEPEVIKKGKKEEEARSAAKRRLLRRSKDSPAAKEEVEDRCAAVIAGLGNPGTVMKRRRTIWVSGLSTSWRGVTPFASRKTKERADRRRPHRGARTCCWSSRRRS